MTDGRKVGIVVADDCALLAKQFNDGKRRRLAQVVDVALVSEAEDETREPFNAFECSFSAEVRLVDHEVRHICVDGASQLNEARAEVEFAGLPG